MPRFYPPNASIPERLLTADFLLEPLHPRHTALDHAALMDSIAMLRRWSLSSWPTDNFTLDENRADLQHHWDEHVAREAFTYTVMNPAGDRCLGCVYINPLARWTGRATTITPPEAASVPDDTAVVTFWIRQDPADPESEAVQAAERALLALLLDWLRGDSWAFQQVMIGTSAPFTRQIAQCEAAGLEQFAQLDTGQSALRLVFR